MNAFVHAHPWPFIAGAFVAGAAVAFGVCIGIYVQLDRCLDRVWR